MKNGKSDFLKSTFLYLSLSLIALLLFIPLPYIIDLPGPVYNVLGKSDDKEIIQTDSQYDLSTTGELLFTTVGVQGGPSKWVNSIDVLYSWFDSSREVLPIEAVYPANMTQSEVDEASKKQMDTSQKIAVVVAENALGAGIDIKEAESNDNFVLPIPISYGVEKVGGPSAGLMLSLGVYSKLSQQNLPNDKKIAGTGTLSYDGKVGPIGGVVQKILGSKKAGATWFLIPEKNCKDIKDPKAVDGINLAVVSSFSQALQTLTQINNNENPASCNL